jgi:hypothetical protein
MQQKQHAPSRERDHASDGGLVEGHNLAGILEI